MEHIMKNLAILSTFLLYTSMASAKEPKQEVICAKPSVTEKVLNEKGYFHLLDVTMENGTKSQFWSGGQDLIITITKDDALCLATTGHDVTYNPMTLDKIMEIWNKSHPKL
jgi:hypothetical protein